MAGEDQGATDGDDPHARPTTALHADELRRLAGRSDENAARIAKASSSVRSERLDVATTELDPQQLGALLAAEPRTSPAVVTRRADTDLDDTARATSVIDPAQLRAMAAAVGRDVAASGDTHAEDDLAIPMATARRPRLQLDRLSTATPLQYPDGGRDRGGLVLLVVAIAMAAFAAILVFR